MMKTRVQRYYKEAMQCSAVGPLQVDTGMQEANNESSFCNVVVVLTE
jgi:hypothetical protein